MDRVTVYYGELPRSVDFLEAQRKAMEGLSALAQALIGSGPAIYGLTLSPASSGVGVTVAPGQFYQMAPIDAMAWGTAQPNQQQILQQGLLTTAQTLSLPVPSSGSTTYTIQAQFQQIDSTPAVLPYLNSANPTQPYAGPGNANTAQNTLRQGIVALQAVAGTSATSGWIALGQVTVADGASSVTASNIQPYNVLNGTTAGTVTWNQRNAFGFSSVTLIVDGYENDSTTNQSITFPTPFAASPFIANNTTGLTVSATASGLTISAPDSTTTYSGVIQIEGILRPAVSSTPANSPAL